MSCHAINSISFTTSSLVQYRVWMDDRSRVCPFIRWVGGWIGINAIFLSCLSVCTVFPVRWMIMRWGDRVYVLRLLLFYKLCASRNTGIVFRSHLIPVSPSHILVFVCTVNNILFYFSLALVVHLTPNTIIYIIWGRGFFSVLFYTLCVYACADFFVSISFLNEIHILNIYYIY